MCVCVLRGNVLPPSCCYVMTSIPAPSPLSTGKCHPQPSAHCCLHPAPPTAADIPSPAQSYLNVHQCAHLHSLWGIRQTQTHTGHVASLTWAHKCYLLCQFSHRPSGSVHVMQTRNKTLSETRSVCPLTWQEQRAVFLSPPPLSPHPSRGRVFSTALKFIWSWRIPT